MTNRDPDSVDSRPHPTDCYKDDLVPDEYVPPSDPAPARSLSLGPEDEDDDRPDVEPNSTYIGTIEQVTDGDTVKVGVTLEDDDGEDHYRVLNVRTTGFDSPEEGRHASRFERPEEWPGLANHLSKADEEVSDHLIAWADIATEYAKRVLDGREVLLVTHDPARGKFDRVLGGIYRKPLPEDDPWRQYDPDTIQPFDGGTDEFPIHYNRETVAKGLARAYHSDYPYHDLFAALEWSARANNLGMWGPASIEDADIVRNNDVESVYFPPTGAVRREDDYVQSERVPIWSEDPATYESHDLTITNVPLAAVDEENNAAMIGGPIIDEEYEHSEQYPVDTRGHGNFVFLLNLIRHVHDGPLQGPIVFDCSARQFEYRHGLALDDVAYFRRFLHGFDLVCDQVNDHSQTPIRGDVLVVTPPSPDSEFSETAVDRITEFHENGGTVVFIGNGYAGADSRREFNRMARQVTDLRLDPGLAHDAENALAENDVIFETSWFDGFDDLFEAIDPEPIDADPDARDTSIDS